MNIWDDLASSHAFVKSERYPKLARALDAIAIEPVGITHTHVGEGADSLYAVLRAPCIEMAPFTIKRDQVNTYYKNLAESMKFFATAKGFVDLFQNNQIEDP